MSYVDQRMGSGRIASIVMVAILHALLGYVLVTGMAYKVVKKAVEDLKTFDVNEEPPPPEEAPPPPEKMDLPPPPTAPVVETFIPQLAPQPVYIPQPTPPRVAPPPPPPPPPPPAPPKIEPAKARANLSSYISNDDYPDDALRADQHGTTAFTLSVGPDGRVTNCTITASSGSSSLDNATCRIMRSRARFTPARDSSGSPTSDSVKHRIKWVLPRPE